MTDPAPAPPDEPIAQVDNLRPAPDEPPPSPRWNVATKFLVALVAIVLIGALLARFQTMLGPLAMAFVLAYVLNPVVEWLTARWRLSWGMAVNVVFLALALTLITGLTAVGIAIQQQAVGLYGTLVEILADLPTRVEDLLARPVALGPLTVDLSRPLVFGPFHIDLTTTNLKPLYDQLLGAIRPALSQTGAFLGTLASGTVEALGWLLFILISGFYLLHDVKHILPSIAEMLPAGYASDVRRLAAEMGPIWHAFLRGQITLAFVMGGVVGLSMWALGVRYPLVLGLLAGLLEFIPVIGPFIAGTVAVLVALFQSFNYFGWNPFYFALLIAGAQVLLSQLENNFLVPRIIGGSLNLHPIIILVGAIIGASLAGIVGLLLSAPLLASLRLVGRYIYSKMFDLHPWPAPPPTVAPTAHD